MMLIYKTCCDNCLYQLVSIAIRNINFTAINYTMKFNNIIEYLQMIYK